MSDAFWVALFTTALPSVLTVTMTIVLAVLASRTKDAVEKAGTSATAAATAASAKADEVKAQLSVSVSETDDKLSDLKKVTNDTHTLVNSNMEKALLVSSVALRRVADITKNEGDVKAAEIAEAALADHRAKQTVVDKAAAEAEPSKVVKAVQQTLGDITRETLADVKVVKQDVKDIKDEK